MADYVPGGSGAGALIVSGTNEFITDAGKQVPGAPPYNAYDRTSVPKRCTINKTPSYVLVTKTMTLPFGFFYGSSASFGELSAAEGNDPLNAFTDIPQTGSLTGSQHYDADWGLVTVGTRLDIHPTAWSGSLADADNIKFIYRSGKSTGGR